MARDRCSRMLYHQRPKPHTFEINRMIAIHFTDGKTIQCLISEDPQHTIAELNLKGFDILEDEPAKELLKDAYRKFLTDKGVFFSMPKPVRPHSRNWKYGYDILPEERDVINYS